MTIRVPSITYNGEEYLLGDEYTAGSGISVSSNQISNTGVTSFNGNTGAVTYTAPVTSVNGSTGAVTVSGLPSGGTNGQILMMVNGTPTWVTPTDKGFIMLSPDSPMTFKYMWLGDDTDYGNVGTYDTETDYQVIE